MKALHLFLLAAVLCLVAPLGKAAGPQVNLAWDYAAADVTTYAVTGFAVEKKTQACSGTGTFAPLATVANTARAFTDFAVTFGSTVCYRVAAVNVTGKGYSNNAEKVLALPAPPNPTLTIEIVITLDDAGQLKVTQVLTK